MSTIFPASLSEPWALAFLRGPFYDASGEQQEMLYAHGVLHLLHLPFWQERIWCDRDYLSDLNNLCRGYSQVHSTWRKSGHDLIIIKMTMHTRQSFHRSPQQRITAVAMTACDRSSTSFDNFLGGIKDYMLASHVNQKVSRLWHKPWWWESDVLKLIDT